MSTDYRNFLALPYEELEELNLKPRKNVSAVSRPTRFAKSGSNI